MDDFNAVMARLGEILNFTLFTFSGNAVTLATLLYLVLGLAILMFLSGRIGMWVARALTRFSDVDEGIRASVGRIVRYVVIAAGVVVILQSAGIDLSALTVLAGAAGVGIGFGLQNIISNFVSGLIIMFERPIRVGDRINVGDVTGDVVAIGARATTIVTNAKIAIIVPNQDFVSGQVINWSYTDRNVRFEVPVGVSYGSDPEEVTRLLLDVATKHEGVLADPRPEVWFQEFGDSSLNFVLLVWTASYITRPRRLRSELNYRIAGTFREHGVEIPFPQRDLHVRSGTLTVRQDT